MVRRPRAGFTSLELTAAVSVILVLAIGVSLLGSEARVRARATSCGSNLRQLAVSMRMYADDEAGHYPPATVAGLAALNEYVKNQQLFTCPSDRHPRKLAKPPTPPGPPSPAGPSAGSPPPPTRTAPAGAPPEISYFVVPGLMADDPPQTLLVGDDAARHRGRWQAACLDGHLERFDGRRQRPPASPWE